MNLFIEIKSRILPQAYFLPVFSIDGSGIERISLLRNCLFVENNRLVYGFMKNADLTDAVLMSRSIR
jgi:hypothetical protein